MKKLVLTAFVGAMVFSCQQKDKDYAVLSGKITNIDTPTDTVYVFNQQRGYMKKIKLNADGTFKDTLKVQEGEYVFRVANQYGTVFLKNNDEINIVTDYPKFDEALKFEGKGENVEKSNMAIQSLLFAQKFFSDEDKTPQQVQEEKPEFLKQYAALLDKYQVSDSIKNVMKQSAEKQVDMYAEYLANKKEFYNKFVGKPAPSFSMQDVNGKTVSLSDLKGKPIYIDIWATWCGPCKAELPALKALEEEYTAKGITFVSISVDEANKKEEWKQFVKDKELKGYQLTTGEGWKNQFVQALEVQGIPRFVLIDANGNIINPDAPRPSSNKIKPVLDELAKG